MGRAGWIRPSGDGSNYSGRTGTGRENRLYVDGLGNRPYRVHGRGQDELSVRVRARDGMELAARRRVANVDSVSTAQPLRSRTFCRGNYKNTTQQDPDDKGKDNRGSKGRSNMPSGARTAQQKDASCRVEK